MSLDLATVKSRVAIFSRDWGPIVLMALLHLVIHLIAVGRYGWFRDELYYFNSTRHIEWGYVDHPPLSIWILALVRIFLGESLAAVRILPILAGAGVIVFAAVLTREMGGRRAASWLAAAAAFAVTGNHFNFHVYSMNWLDILIWQISILILVRLFKRPDSRLFLLFGLTAGIGLLNKISVLFLWFGLVAGLVLTKERRRILDLRFWSAGGLSLALFLPYIIWNAVSGWPHLEFIHNARTFKMASVSALDFFFSQAMYNNPVNLFLWLSGLAWLLFHPGGRRFRTLGWLFLSIYVLFTIQGAKDYYLAGGYPVLFAAGAILWDSVNRRKVRQALVAAGTGLILTGGLISLPLAVPVLPVETTARMAAFTGIVEKTSGERHQKGILPQHFADMLGWPEMVDKVAEAASRLTPEERRRAIVFTMNYGQAGAVNLLRRQQGLPPAYSGHNNHFFWPPPADVEVAILIGSRKILEEYFESGELVARTESRFNMPYENDLPIRIYRGMKKPFGDIWPCLKHFN